MSLSTLSPSAIQVLVSLGYEVHPSDDWQGFYWHYNDREGKVYATEDQAWTDAYDDMLSMMETT